MDEELPGFKVNDYSGSGDEPETDEAITGDATTVAGVAEVIAGDKEAPTGGVMAEGRVENGSVTHGEGEIKPIMLENEPMGGVKETTLKTAPEQPKTASEVAKTVPEQQKSRKKLIIGVVIGVLVLALIGVGVWLVLGRGEGVSDVPDELETSRGGAEEKPEEDGDQEVSGVVEVSVDDEVVRRVYNNFSHAESAWDNGVLFYVEALRGSLSRDQMMKMAFYKLQEERAQGDDGSVEANYCKGEHPMAGNEEWLATDCYSGQEMRDKIEELFGIDDFIFAEGDEAATVCRYPYDTENDEFYQTKWCGGAVSRFLIRKLLKAEKDEERLYLYEKAVFWSALSGEEGFYKLGENGWDVPVEELSWSEPWFETVGEVIETPESDELVDQFKWTFRKDGENYVFESLEKVK